MALNTQHSNATRSVGADAIAALANGGKLQIYDGAQPAAGGAVTTQTKLAEFVLPNPAFGAAANGVATANAIAAVTILATGTAAWFRVLKSDSSIAWDGSAGVAADTPDLVLNSKAFQAGAQASITAWTYTFKAQG